MSNWQPHIERTSQPWFGPRGRGKQVLTEHRSDVLAPEAALDEFRSVLGERAEGISNIRFVDYVNTRDNFRYTIAVCWTVSDPVLRDALFEQASLIVQRTGWYPLPQGERLRSVEAGEQLHPGLPAGQLPAFQGRIQAIEAAVPAEDGCSIRVEMTCGGSLLLDTGLPDKLDLVGSERVVLLSHTHGDHVGGLTTRRTGSLPTLMSRGTARILRASPWVRDTELIRNWALSGAGESIRLGSIEVECFMVPHFPGAVGWIVRDDRSALVFTGDICLRTARHDFIRALVDVARAQSPRDTTVLLDATMAGRAAGASAAEASTQLLQSVTWDVVLAARSEDHLLYAFLDLFHTVQQSDRRHSISFLVTPRLRLYFEILHLSFITRQFDDMDPLLMAQYGRSMSSWAESRWLFWLDTTESIPEGRRLWFLVASELESFTASSPTAIATIGRDDLANYAPAGGPGLPATNTDTTPWTAHSDAASLADACRAISSDGHRVVLFHNFSKRMRKFIREEQLEAEPLSGRVQLAGADSRSRLPD